MLKFKIWLKNAFGYVASYRYPQRNLEKHLWKQISAIQDANNGPWFMTGDLNELSDPIGKLSQHPDSSIRYKNFIHKSGLVDIWQSWSFFSLRIIRERILKLFLLA